MSSQDLELKCKTRGEWNEDPAKETIITVPQEFNKCVVRYVYETNVEFEDDSEIDFPELCSKIVVAVRHEGIN